MSCLLFLVFLLVVGNALGLCHRALAPREREAHLRRPFVVDSLNLRAYCSRLVRLGCKWIERGGWRILGDFGLRMRRCPFLLVYHLPCHEARHSTLILPGDRDQRRVMLAGFATLSLTGIALAVLCELPEVLERGFCVFLDWNWNRPTRALMFFVLVVALGMLAFTVVAFVRGLRPWGAQCDVAVVCLSRGFLAWVGLLALLFCGFTFGSGVLGTMAQLNQHGRALFLYARVMHPGLGLTPVLPLLVIAATFYLACLFRLRLLRRICTLQDVLRAWQSPHVGGLGQTVRRGFLRVARRNMLGLVAAGLVVGALCYGWDAVRIRSLEGWWFDLLVSMCFGMLFALIVACTVRAYRLGAQLRFHLHAIAVHPVAHGLDRLPTHIARKFQTAMPGQLDAREMRAAEADWLRQLAALDPPSAAFTSCPTECIGRLLDQLAPEWHPTTPADPARPSDVRRTLKENLVALRLAEVLALMCDATRTTMFIAAVGAVAAVLATGAYPFQPAATLGWAAMAAVFMVVGVAAWVIVNFERDEVLSRIGKTKVGEVTASWSLLARIGGYVIVPLATLLGSYLPNHTRLLHVLGDLSKLLER